MRDAAAMAAAIDDRTVLVVASAPSYAHGVVDPVTEIAAAAAERGVRCHVDACIGGWVLPYAARLGRDLPPWTFAVDGVTSISVDLHKYAYAPKGTSILLHRTPALRRPQYFASAAWPGYTMLNSTMQSTKSGGPWPGRGRWCSTIGDEGYLELTRKVLEGVDRLVAGIAEIPGLRVVVRAGLDAGRARDRRQLRRLHASPTRWRGPGWYVQPQLSFGAHGPTIHLSLSAATAAHVQEFLEALRGAVDGAVASGPMAVDPDVADFVRALDAADASATTTSTACSPRRVWLGDPSAGLALPESMAPVNALLDLAAPALREALLTAFLDRLQRPA